MARKLKPLKVRDWRYGDQVFEIYLDRNDVEFTANADGTIIRAKDEDSVKQAIRDVMNEQYNYDWKPVIEVEQLDVHNHGHAFLGFIPRRYYVALTKNNEYVMHSWEDGKSPDPYYRHASNWYAWSMKQNGVFAPPCNNTFVNPNWRRDYTPQEKTFFFEHNEDMWAGLVKLQFTIIELKKVLHAMLQTAEGVEQIQAVGKMFAGLLPAKTLERGDAYIDPNTVPVREVQSDDNAG